MGEKGDAGITTDSVYTGAIENAKVVDKKNFADSGFFFAKNRRDQPEVRHLELLHLTYRRNPLVVKGAIRR